MERAPVQFLKVSKSLDIGNIGLKEQSKAKISFNIVHFDMIPPSQKTMICREHPLKRRESSLNLDYAGVVGGGYFKFYEI